MFQTQYKEYEAKCESYREQLLQKREVLRKKREAKEAEVAAAAVAAKASYENECLNYRVNVYEFIIVLYFRRQL